MRRELALKNGINFVSDIYHHYGSNGSAALTAGYDIRGGFFTPWEANIPGQLKRTHAKALDETYKLTKLYIENCI